MARDIRWNKYVASRWSPDTKAKSLPMSVIRDMQAAPMGPSVSKARGTNSYFSSRAVYLAVFLKAAISAAAPALMAVAETYDAAKVSITVTSQTRLLPTRHGIKVRPSGLLPSERTRPGGSFTAGKPAFMRLRHMMSFIAPCLAILPKPRGQDNPWLPLTLTVAPHPQECGWQMATPSLRPTAILTASSLRRRPQVAIGNAYSQSPACCAETALYLARSTVSTRFASTSATSLKMRGRSHPAWERGASQASALIPVLLLHSSRLDRKRMSAVEESSPRMDD